MNPACMVRPVIPKPRAAPGGLMSLATFGANFSLAAALMCSAWAQSATVERSAKGAAATNIQIGLYLNVKPDCTSGTLPAIRLLAPPANGTLTIKRGKVRPPTTNSASRSRCPASSPSTNRNPISPASTARPSRSSIRRAAPKSNASASSSAAAKAGRRSKSLSASDGNQARLCDLIDAFSSREPTSTSLETL